MLDIGIKKMLFSSEWHLLVSKNAWFLSCRMGMCPFSLPGHRLSPPCLHHEPVLSPHLLGCVLSADRAGALGGRAPAQPDTENPHIKLWLGTRQWGTGSSSEPGANATAWLLNPLAAPTCTPRTPEILLGEAKLHQPRGSKLPPNALVAQVPAPSSLRKIPNCPKPTAKSTHQYSV